MAVKTRYHAFLSVAQVRLKCTQNNWISIHSMALIQVIVRASFKGNTQLT